MNVSDSGNAKQVTAEKNPKVKMPWVANEAETSESESRAERKAFLSKAEASESESNAESKAAAAA